MKRRSLASLLLLAAFSLPVAAQVSFEGSDPSIRPQDDLFRFANGAWINKTSIPNDKSSYGTFTILDEQADRDVRVLLEEAAKHPEKSRDSQLIGNFYASLMDLKTLDRLGTRPLKKELARIDSLGNLEEVVRLMGEFQQIHVSSPIAVVVSADDKNPLINAVIWGQSGLGMPDRDYYLKKGDKAEDLRKAYVDYLTTLSRSSGTSKADARKVMAFETKLAAIQWPKADLRDPLKTYNFSERKNWTKDYGAFPWDRFADGAGMPESSGAIVNEPSYFKGLVKLASDTPMGTWKAYLRYRLLDAYASNLSKDFREAQFRFYEQKLQGVTSMQPRWKTAVGQVGDKVGEAIGVRYVAKRFSSDSKQRVAKLVDNLLAAYREDLESLEWMTPATRKAALEKLGKIRVKVGYPEHWRGYQGLSISRDAAVANELRTNRFLYQRDMREAGKAVDLTRWGMTPQTVNAYYNPVGNEIVFPAAILQPPFFDPKADDAFNYGAIGAVIGHEITHGFDDQGRHYDADGRLRDWWTAADEKAFMGRADRLVTQYGAYEPLPGERVNGRFTLGENIADLGGVTMALKAYQRSLGEKKAPILDGLSGNQRFFLAFARTWRIKKRPAALSRQLVSDPHSPGQYRTNGVVVNVEGFYDAFSLKAGDRLYKAPEERVHIW